MGKAKKGETTYKTGEACKELDVQPYVLRYWETEFPMISGKKAGSQKVYSAGDLAVLRRIKELLYDEGYTIAGAKKRIEVELDDGGPPTDPSTSKPAPSKAGKRSGGAAASSKPSKTKAAKTKTASGEDDASLDTVSHQSIETVLPELRDLHRQAVEILELVRD